MERCSLYVLIALSLAFAACGGSSKSNTTTNAATGAWTETLSTSSGQQLGAFTFNMTQNSTSLSGSSMNFSNMSTLSQCFGSGTTMSGQMGSGMMNGGTMNMTMSWTPQGGTGTNTMTMQGTMANGMGSGSGTFTLTGQTAGCTSQSGTFTMTHTSNSMM